MSRQAFIWCRHTDGSITVRDEHEGALRTKVNESQYAAVLNLLTHRANGICLGTISVGKAVPDHLGWLLTSFGMHRSHASWIVAVAAEEGFVKTVHRGKHATELWLMPVTECCNRNAVV